MLGMITHVQRFGGGRTAGSHRHVEYFAVRLGGPRGRRRDHVVEHVAQADLREIGVAIGQCDQGVSPPETGQRGPNLGEHLDIVALLVKDRERVVDHAGAVAGGLAHPAQHGTSQEPEIVQAITVLGDNRVADLANRIRREQFGNARIMLGKPRIQTRLRAPDYRTDGPERIVQVEGDGPNVVHELLTCQEWLNIGA